MCCLRWPCDDGAEGGRFRLSNEPLFAHKHTHNPSVIARRGRGGVDFQPACERRFIGIRFSCKFGRLRARCLERAGTIEASVTTSASDCVQQWNCARHYDYVRYDWQIFLIVFHAPRWVEGLITCPARTEQPREWNVKSVSSSSSI